MPTTLEALAGGVVMTQDEETARNPSGSVHRTGGADRPASRRHRSGASRQRVSYDEYLLAAALTIASRHRPVWSWQRWRRVCRCGNDLPCRNRHRVPINRGHWLPSDRSWSRGS
ncbi:hypothetical protein EYA84_06180 [Verrucosispora sp. SN26_14.1]|nr:hypothetical protein EYA84_06180 [Verrucosispora sp. SN26_14.1]